MAYGNHQETLAEVKETVAEIKKDAGLSSKASVRADFLNEDPKSFGTESMSYEQVAVEIIEENEELFALSRLCDRFVPQYLKICKTLEKTVEYLGSVCVTKSALKYYQRDVSAIGNLTVERLHQMISFNFRKVKAALDEKKTTLHEFDLDLYNQMLSFAKVMQRLRVTESKALAIDLGLEEPGKLTKRTTNFRKNQSASVTPLRELPSYPIHYEVIRGQESVQCSVDSEQDSCQDSVVSEQPSALTPQEIERQAKYNLLDDEEKSLYAEALKRPDIVEDMRSKVINKGYCYLHQAEIRSFQKILAVIDST